MGILKPTEYASGNRHEQYSGEAERRKIAVSGAAWGGAATGAGLSSAALAAHRTAGSPMGQRVLGAAALKHPEFKEPIQRFAARGKKVAAKPKTVLGATLGLAAAGTAAGTVARFRRNEEQGISQGVGRFKAGSRYQRDQQRIAKSLMSNAGMIGSLSQDPATRKLIAHVASHRVAYGIGAGALTATGGTVEGIRRGKARSKEVKATRVALAKGGAKFATVGALTGTGGLGTSVAVRRHDRQTSNEIAAGTVGGWAGQGAYQGAGYGAKWRAQAKQEPKTSRSQRDKQLKPVKQKHGAYTPAMERNYPKALPEARTHRVLGWTHRGKTGTALGGALTLAGTYGGARMVQRKDKVHKSFGYETKRTSPLRTTEAAVGVTLLGWGGSRLGLTKATLAMGSRKAGNIGVLSRRAEKARQAVETTTGHGAAMLGSKLNTGFRLRPVEGAVGGGLLVNHAMPVRRKEFTPVRAPAQQGGY